ncbi:MAG: hypothetical protein LUH11_01825 [Candidatus Gastranaerophilales bacterium]|nr:hypothetical protein [Candidatus Gastranaerophilales bacterium]
MEHKNECSKYEGLFIFQNEEAFNESLEYYPECKAEHEKYLKVSKLIKEAAPIYLAKKRKEKHIAIIKLACCFLFLTGLVTFTGYKMYDNYMFNATGYDSYITAIGLPVDDYGFLDL